LQLNAKVFLLLQFQLGLFHLAVFQVQLLLTRLLFGDQFALSLFLLIQL